MFQKSATSKNALSGRWASGCLLAGALMAATAPSLSAQPPTTLNSPTRAPFILALVANGVPAADYTVPNLFAVWGVGPWNWVGIGSSATTPTSYGTNLVLEHIHIIYSGAIGSFLNVQFQPCYDQSFSGAATSAKVCPYMVFQTPPVSQTPPAGEPAFVSAHIPVTISIPTVSTSPVQASLSNFYFSVPGGAWSRTMPAGSGVVISGHFEPLGLP